MQTEINAELWLSHGIDINDRKLMLIGDVDTPMLKRVVKGVGLLSSSEDPVVVILSTPGGSIPDGLAIYSILKNAKFPVAIYALGEVCSIGMVILQAGTKRVSDHYAAYMIHGASLEIADKSLESAQREVDITKFMEGQFKTVLLDRIQEKIPEFTPAKFAKICVHDTWLTAEECLQIGLVDEIG